MLKRLEIKYGNLYNIKNVMISSTHSHSTPGGFMMEVLFDITTLGFVKQTFDALVNGITLVIIFFFSLIFIFLILE